MVQHISCKRGDWAAIEAEIGVEREDEENESDGEGWRTRGQLMKLHNNGE